MATDWLASVLRYSCGAEALPAYRAFAGHARAQLEAHPEWTEWLARGEISGSEREPRGFAEWSEDLAALGSPPPAEAADRPETLLAPLRRLKRREMLRLGLLDFAGLATVDETVETISDLADFCLRQVMAMELERLGRRWGRPGTGFCVLAMGKLGGRELNYSSDIDVVFVFGEDGQTEKGHDRKEFFARLGQAIVQDFSARTADGALFRIDLRLRPEGDSGPLAMSLLAAENYYAAYGETWERMAMIKMRVSAGDEALSYDLDRLRNEFCFSVALTPEIIGEIAALKKRIDREVVGQNQMEHHVKLGRGGIREIEFIVQTQQLLHARRLPYLQFRRTLKTLEGLHTCELMPAETASKLAQAYRWLRTVEHRLQMREDLQTHSLPPDAATRGEIAASLGLEPDAFEQTMAEVRGFVHREFKALFSRHEHPTVREADFGFFRDPAAARKQAAALSPASRGDAALASPRTLARYRRFEPVLEAGLRRCVDPDTALPRFVRFAKSYGAPGLFYETMAANPKALELLLTIFERSRYYSEMLTRSPHLFEDAARAGTLDTNKSSARFLRELEALHGDLPDAARAYRQEELTRIFIRDALELASLRDLHAECSALARACLEFGLRHVVKGGPLAVIGLGKFGGGELTYGSDVDCLLVSDDPEAGVQLNHFMMERRPMGTLFRLDCRMRPDGEGALARPLAVYEKYYRDRAQYWEIQAATRACLVAGDQALGEAFIAILDEVWPQRAASADPFEELGRMRGRIQSERVNPAFVEGEFKTGAGGMMDVEFAVQAVLLERRHREPGTLGALDWLESLSDTGRELAGKFRRDYLWLRRIEAVIRADANAAVSALPRDPGAQYNLSRWLGFPGWEGFLSEYRDVRSRVRANYERVMRREVP
ncbi:MAG: DUF294 nucleotidyltransferase-like domain-containing protein [Verrucomicrobiota bacterium]